MLVPDRLAVTAVALIIAALGSTGQAVAPAASTPAPIAQAPLPSRHGNYQISAALLKNLPASQKPDSRGLTLLGLSLRRLHRDGDAISPLKRALLLAPQDLDDGIT